MCEEKLKRKIKSEEEIIGEYLQILPFFLFVGGTVFIYPQPPTLAISLR